MSRPLRIQYPDAWYHVMNRDEEGNLLFWRNRIDNLAKSRHPVPDRSPGRNDDKSEFLTFYETIKN
ncbi:MAG: hypothetical protein JRJ86_19845 [Deltaproteobacteria bacterium]|nr:hypothetical protein [Deltaproteobacteria bacterium]MBW2118978.1 hypothetical protein [Deltaproteobacteria bacterium]MBW2345740.1 hypothetical protein [Deltaproteobacteria bacterium]